MVKSIKKIPKPADILKVKKVILKKYQLVVEKDFDTFTKEKGNKDVSLCRAKQIGRVILRIGEARPADFFPQGYRGGLLVIPRLYQIVAGDIPFEIEEYIKGPYVAGAGGTSASPDGKLKPELLAKLINVFWEFQIIAADIHLEPLFSKNKILDHLKIAEKHLENFSAVKSVVDSHKDFWKGKFPSKWKFATDNLILTDSGKIAFIDLGHVGLRYWGYDLGWLIWPRWVEMETKYYNDVSGYIDYLDNFNKIISDTAPDNFFHKKNIISWFWLVIIERAIGALFDIENNTKHLKEWRLDKRGDQKRRRAHINFINKLLKVSLART
ncbi:MAG: hypothetical protein V1712_04265 [Patescibacteria group bacterium]